MKDRRKKLACKRNVVLKNVNCKLSLHDQNYTVLLESENLRSEPGLWVMELVAMKVEPTTQNPQEGQGEVGYSRMSLGKELSISAGQSLFLKFYLL